MIDNKRAKINTVSEDDNLTDDKNNKEQKLRPDAPEFDGFCGYDPHSNIDPYAHPLGVSTRPEYVPPAEIPPKVTRTNVIPSGNPITNNNLTQPYPQPMYTTTQTRTGQQSRVQGYPLERPTTTSHHITHGQLHQEPSPHMHPHPYGNGHGMVPRNNGVAIAIDNDQNPTVSSGGHNLNAMLSPHTHMQSNETIRRSQGGTPLVAVSNNTKNNSGNTRMMAPGYSHMMMGGTGPVSSGGNRYDVTNTPQDYESGHSQHNGDENVQESYPPKLQQPIQGVYQERPRGDMVSLQHGGQMSGYPITQQPSPHMHSKQSPPPGTHTGQTLHPRVPLHMPMPMQPPYGGSMQPPGYEKTKQYQPYGGEDENSINTTRMQQGMPGNIDVRRQYEHWKSQNRHPPTLQHGTSPATNNTVGMPSNPPLFKNTPGVPVGTNPGTLHGLSPSGTGGLSAMPQSGHKSVSRNFGAPKPEDIDPEFTNPQEFVRYQRWELLESAKRWLPGEGTVITWKGFCYVIGAPIHMGMNGHIHFCYRYKLPEWRNESSTNTSNVNGTYTNESEGVQNNNDGGSNRPHKFSKKDVATVAAKIMPNTSAFAREIVILRDLQGCENVTTLYEVLESKRTLISILELAKADVYHFFVGREASRHGWSLEKPAVREAFARMVVTNAVQGLKQMHDKEYLHCDLKSLNILLYIYKNQNSRRQGGVYMKAKLTDFGHSSKGKYRTAEATFKNGMARVGTAGHVAPELFKEGVACDNKIDIWSLGIVMFSMLVPGRLLFGEYTHLDSLKKAYDALNKMNPWSNQQRPNWWTDFERLSPEARDLILWMTRFNAEERPTGEQIMKHPWFQISMGNLKPGQYRPKLKYVDMLCSSSIAQE